jgi:hypothetical protein
MFVLPVFRHLSQDVAVTTDVTRELSLRRLLKRRMAVETLSIKTHKSLACLRHADPAQWLDPVKAGRMGPVAPGAAVC